MTSQNPLVDIPSPKLSRDSTPALMRPVNPAAETRVWNTKHLGLRLAADFTSGFTAACMVAPIITIIDK